MACYTTLSLDPNNWGFRDNRAYSGFQLHVTIDFCLFEWGWFMLLQMRSTMLRRRSSARTDRSSLTKPESMTISATALMERMSLVSKNKKPESIASMEKNFANYNFAYCRQLNENLGLTYMVATYASLVCGRLM